MTENFDMIKAVYEGMEAKLVKVKEIVGRPLTYTEKILYSHLWETPTHALERGKDYVDLAPDRVAMQDATAQMALLQFMMAGNPHFQVGQNYDPSSDDANWVLQFVISSIINWQQIGLEPNCLAVGVKVLVCMQVCLFGRPIVRIDPQLFNNML